MRIIDADQIPKEISADPIENNGFWETIDEMPTIDAVQVVRCKDCIYYYPAEYDKKGNTCLMLRNMVNAPIWVKEDDYCSKGVKAE